MPIDIPKKGTLQRKNIDKLWSAELQTIVLLDFIYHFRRKFL